jgi:hypothetical protein
MYIFTGSSTNETQTIHTGTGRFSVIKMYPMSISEQNITTNNISLTDMFDDKEPNNVIGKLKLKDLIQLSIKGG